MLNMDEIEDNSRILSFEEYSSILSENYLSQSARLRCLQLEQENASLKKELEKYKTIVKGDISVRQNIISEAFDRMYNESDYVGKKFGMSDVSGIVGNIYRAVRKGETPSAEYTAVRYYPVYFSGRCSSCGSLCMVHGGKIRTSFYLDDKIFRVKDEAFPVAECSKCKKVILDMYASVVGKRSVIREGSVTPEMAAYIICGKLLMNTSLMSLEMCWRAKKLELPRSFFGYIINEVCDVYFEPLYNRLREELLNSGFITAVCKRVPVCTVNESDGAVADKGGLNMFAYCTAYSDEKHIVVFDSGKDVPANKEKAHLSFLKDYSGILHTDRTGLFSFQKRKFEVIPMWGEAERLINQIRNGKDAFDNMGEASECISEISQIKAVIRDEENVDEEMRLTVRRSNCMDLTDGIIERALTWQRSEKEGGMGEIFEFILKNADELNMFYSDSRTEFDNARCISELNVFGTDQRDPRLLKENSGYHRVMIMMSILRTLEACNLDAQRYIVYFLKNYSNNVRSIEELLPWNAPTECRKLLSSENNK